MRVLSGMPIRRRESCPNSLNPQRGPLSRCQRVMNKTLLLLAIFFLPIPAFLNGVSQVDLPSSVALPWSLSDNAISLSPPLQPAVSVRQAKEFVSVIVTLKDRANLGAVVGLNRAERNIGTVRLLQNTASTSQRSIRQLLETRRAQGQVTQVTYFWIFNGMAVTATPAVVQELAARPDVLRVTPDETIQAPPLPPAGQGQIDSFASQPNLDLTNVPALWNLGYRGQGVVVANTDTGVDVTHPDLGPKWRGGANSWFDPYGQHPTTPTDLAGSSSGHGTQTMGVMVGGQHNGAAFGLAPAAKWIAVKIFRDNGSATTAGIHAGFQWLLDPDGNPGTADAPHVVNNSWTAALGCNLEFQADLQALRAAGILPIFAAGNFGPSAASSASPANYPEAFSVGAISNSNIIKSDSSRGPSACDGTIFPEVVAPGVSIHTTDRFGLYTNASGTSIAAPHVAGGLALLLSAYPGMPVTEQENMLLNSTADLGASGPDDTYGQGRIDMLTALQSISADMSVAQTASAGSMAVGEVLTYTLTISNTGPMTTTGVVFTSTFSTQISLAFITFSQGTCSEADPVTITCTFGNMANGAAVTGEISVASTGPGMLTHTVSVASVRPDLYLENSSFTVNTTVFAQIFLPVVIK